MLQPLSTLPISKQTVVINLCKKGYLFVEDVNYASNDDFDELVNIVRMKNMSRSSITLSTLDYWQAELQYERITTFSDVLNQILEGGIQCGTITEICGPSGSGKTQLCFQISVIVQLSLDDSGLAGRSLFVDTRNTFSPQRIQDMITEHQVYPSMDFNRRWLMIAKNITVVSPETPEELFLFVKKLWQFMQSSLNDNPIRVIIIDSLAFTVASLNDSSMKTSYYLEILDELQKVASKYNIAVVIANELMTRWDTNGEMYIESAGGQTVASRCNKRLMLGRLNNSKFAARLLKSSTISKVAILFNITEQGIGDENNKK